MALLFVEADEDLGVMFGGFVCSKDFHGWSFFVCLIYVLINLKLLMRILLLSSEKRFDVDLTTSPSV